eukprot:TRINITY_DN2373_c0_g1_i2.p1 TRINITY_DN2373_c0_g1~~TRINITY_DN2373_c0_g1_i2.p1  ORF type:complete len:121 (-),score=40.37 TRINITY_DN2373_c0_g1_i2:83-445(-)
MLSVKDAASIIAYGDVEISRMTTPRADRFSGGDAPSEPPTAVKRTLKVTRIGDDEFHFSLEEEMETFKVVLDKADMVVLNALINASIPFMVGFTEVFKMGMAPDYQDTPQFNPLDSQIWQ